MTPLVGTPHRPIDIIVPFYHNADLVGPLFESLNTVKNELAALHGSLITVNDSPGNAGLAVALENARRQISPWLFQEHIENIRNEGFIRSVNKGLQRAVERGHDVLLLNSDTLLFPGALTAMHHVAYLDPMIGFVNPRSNNATICSLPHQGEYRNQSSTAAYEAFTRLAHHLREYQFVPTAVGFCMLIKFEVLEEFGLFDESYGRGYNEENDLVMRANRCGYRAALANRAFVYHIGEKSFGADMTGTKSLRETNSALLDKRYPEYFPGIALYDGSVRYEAERMLAALLPDAEGRYGIVFDLSSVGPYYNGTFEAAKQILVRAASRWSDSFRVAIMASEAAVRFHRLDKLPVSIVTPDTDEVFAVAFRFGQPFDWQQMARLSRVGVVNVYAMLDPIALDCYYLNWHGLESLWSGVFGYADAVIYISEFVAEQFRRRFRIRPGLREVVSYLSLDLRDYEPKARPDGAGRHILVIGNAFEHKFVKPTVEALHQAFPDERIVALGAPEPIDGSVNYGSGYLSESTIQELMSEAKFVVYPSLYEGFGIPVLESLAYRKPILARGLPVIRDICDRLRAEENLTLYNSTRDLIRRLRDGFPTWKESDRLLRENASAGWSSIVDRLGEVFRELIGSVSVEDVLLPRLQYFRLLAPGTGQAPPDITGLLLGLRNRDEQIAELRRSLSWKVSAPLRALGEVYLRMARKSVPFPKHKKT